MLFNMYSTCLEKQKQIKSLFDGCVDQEAKYQKIIELGKTLPKIDPAHRTPQNIVPGCQSIMYLHSLLEDGKVYFTIGSDALISAGLAALLTHVYNGETPETILKCPPDYLEELNIGASLTPGRANGLHNIHLRMKQDALKFYLSQNT